MDGTEKAKIALSDAGAFNWAMHKYGVKAHIDIRTRERILENCRVYPAAACVYRVDLWANTRFDDVTKYEREVRAAIASGRKQIGYFDKQMSLRFDIEPFLTLEVDAPPGEILPYEFVPCGPLQAGMGRVFSLDGQREKVFDLNVEYQTLIAALSGHGKSVLLQNIITGILANTPPSELSLYCIDFKNSDLHDYRSVPHCDGYAFKAEDAADIFAKVYAEVEKRIDSRKKNHKTVLLAIDELAEVDKAHDDALASIMKRGRSLGVHVLAATQHPTSAQIGVKTARSFTHRITGRMDNANSAFWATGVADTGAELLRQKGSFLYVYGGQVERFQSFYLDADSKRVMFERIAEYKGTRRKKE